MSNLVFEKHKGKYQKGSFKEPDPFVDPKIKKSKKYGAQQAEFLYSTYLKYNSNMFLNKRAHYSELIDYAQGNQSISRHKKSMDLDKNQDKSWVNLDWRIRNYATKRVNIIIDKLHKLELAARFEAIDPIAVNHKKERQGRLRMLMELQSFFQEVSQFSNIDPSINEKVPEDSLELEILLDNNYKDDYALGLELAIEAMLNEGDYKKIDKMVCQDLAIFGLASVWSDSGKNCYPENKYIAPDKLVVPPSKYSDFSDINRGGYLEEMSFEELRKAAGNQFKDNEYKDILENATQKRYNNEGRYDDESDDEVGKVQVLHFYFLTDDEDVYERKFDEQGRSKIYKTKFSKGTGNNYKTKVNENGVEYRTNGKNQIYRDKYQVVYSGHWIVGTDYVYGYGLKTNMERDKHNLNKVYPPLKISAPNLKKNKVVSIVEQMMPILDDIQIYILKMNQLVGNAVPKGVFIDLDALENANMIGQGGKVMTPEELLKLYFQKGVIVGRTSSYTGAGSSYKPIQELENGLARDLMSYVGLIQTKVSELDEVIGMNEITSGSTPSPDIGKAVSALSVQHTNHAIGHLFDGKADLFTSIVKSMERLYLEMVRKGYAHQMFDAMGIHTTNNLSHDVNMSSHRYGMKIEVLPGEEEWQEFKAILAQSLGKPDGIDEDDFFLISGIKNLKLAQKTLEVRLKQKKKQKMEESIALQQQNAQTQMQSAQVAQQAELEKEKQLFAMKQELILLEEEQKRLTIQHQKDLELRNMTEKEVLQGKIEEGLIDVKKDANIEEGLATGRVRSGDHTIKN